MISSVWYGGFPLEILLYEVYVSLVYVMFIQTLRQQLYN